MHRCLLPILVLMLASSNAFALRCGTRLVDNGDRDFQVRDRCGEPFWTDRYVNVEIVGAYGPLEHQSSVQFDVWYYNFGPRQLMHKMVFRDGVLFRDDTLGYGVNEIGDDCNENGLFDGFSAGELFARCGEPASRRSQTDTIVRRPVRGIEQWRDHRREEWIYDFGDNRFVSSVRLVDGRVDGVERVRR
jgi:hypothetical protein